MALNRTVLFASQSVDWPTPRALYDALHAEFAFDFDPCPLGGEQEPVLFEARSGLATLFSTWADKRVYCNPPYGPEIRKWLERGLEAECAVFLLPARTDTKWFHEIVIPKASEIRFIKGRLKFGDATNAAPFPSMLVIFRREDVG